MKTLAVVIALCGFALAQSTTCVTSKDGLSTKCTDNDGSTFGTSCYKRTDGSLFCEHYRNDPGPPPAPLSERIAEELVWRQRREQCPKTCKKPLQCDYQGYCQDPRKSDEQRIAEARSRAAEAEREAHDELCAAHQLPAEQCKL